jgi:hypothetical protein
MKNWRTVEKVCFGLTLLGLLAVGLALGADVLGIDITPGFGLVQIISLLAGITSLTVAAYLFLNRRRIRGSEIPLPADIGIRLSMSGLLACYVSGLADMVGVGTHRGAEFQRPFLGPLQLIGLLIGLLFVTLGLLLFWLGNRYQPRQKEDASIAPQPRSTPAN